MLEFFLAPIFFIARLVAFAVGYLSDDPFYLVLFVSASVAIIYVAKRVK